MARLRKSEEAREKARELARTGHSVRKIEEIMGRDGTPMSKSVVAAVAAAARAEGASGVLEDEPLTLDLTNVHDLDLAELRALAGLFQKSLTSALAAKDAGLAVKLLDGRLTVAREVQRLRPPTPPDPARDPANVQAREDLRARLERLRSASLASPPAVEQARAYLGGG